MTVEVDKIKANLKREREILNYLIAIERVWKSPDETEFYDNIKKTLMQELKILNSAIPDILSEIVAEETKIKPSERIQKRLTTLEGNVSVKKSDRQNYLKFLQIEEEALKSIKKKIAVKAEGAKVKEEFKKVGFYTRTAGRLFSGISLNLSRLSVSKSISENLKKSNMPFLLSTYISMTLLGSLIAFIFGMILISVFIISDIIPAMIGVPLMILFPFIIFVVFCIYPSSEASGNKTKINDELPFAIMHMSAIAGSGIEPSKIFGIIAAGEEYPAIKKEMRKIINQINFYGYDLVGSLRATAKTTSSDRLQDVLNGIATTISSGGDLKEYLNKVAADTLLDYKLRRKRFTTISETYADIYTGLLVAAPLMFMLILVLMNVIGGGIGGMSSGTLALVGIGALIVINIGFLVFLQFSQPES